MPDFFTIGHSNRSLDEFIALLVESKIERVVDVRAFPRSRTNPQFNIDTLPAALAEHGIGYEHLAALGGRRGSVHDKVPIQINGHWTHQSFHNYADYALSETFRHGLDHLIAAGGRQRCAIMCSEAVWWRCHRRIISDYLLAHGETVLHILAPHKVEAAKFNEGAEVHADGTITYPGAPVLFD
ncbi:DUF488 family protein [Solilutibacter silvestris]|uniref:DUF488 domain-containing protein n=1 Tax=Solilutibacter silvestris TaxID=1645665 RepID=A0A2K1PZF4_9GAMM|nr:DUF488 domain-containing protein [Lysobacter silvestris]PNS08182.1 hypothetical protein Lysil_2358 [Lysobacter silvestris]